MKNSRKFKFVNYIIIFFISATITLFWGNKDMDLQNLIVSLSYGVVIGISIALGSSYFSRLIFKNADITIKPTFIFTKILLIVSAYILVDLAIINLVWILYLTSLPLLKIFLLVDFYYYVGIEFVIGIIIFLIFLSLRFIRELANAESQKNEIMRAAEKFKYETLKFQVNPHFLFNSLNTLSALINIDTQKADDFTLKLSDIYRYILDYNEEELVSINKELDFIRTYAELQAIRFDNNFDLKIEIENTNQNSYIIPMSIQLIIENILKYNIISKENLLTINISTSNDNEYIIIENNRNKKENNENSHNMGINNIRNRFATLTNKKIISIAGDNNYIVKLPIINIEKA